MSRGARNAFMILLREYSLFLSHCLLHLCLDDRDDLMRYEQCSILLEDFSLDGFFFCQVPGLSSIWLTLLTWVSTCFEIYYTSIPAVKLLIRACTMFKMRILILCMQKFAEQFPETLFLKFYGNSNADCKHLIEARVQAQQTPFFTFFRHCKLSNATPKSFSYLHMFADRDLIDESIAISWCLIEDVWDCCKSACIRESGIQQYSQSCVTKA